MILGIQVNIQMISSCSVYTITTIIKEILASSILSNTLAVNSRLYLGTTEET